jgi:hypothetical protein
MSKIIDAQAKTKGTIGRDGMSPQLGHKISQRIKIYAPEYGDAYGAYKRMGLISNFTPPTDSRDMYHARGIGHGDQVAEIIPGKSGDYKLDIERSALWTANLFQVLGYRGGTDGLVRALKHHRYPFDIKQEEVFSTVASAILGADTELGMSTPEEDLPDGPMQGANLLAQITYYETCWISDYSYSVSTDTAQIMEKVSCAVTDITTSKDGSVDITYDTGNAPKTSGTARSVASMLGLG